MLFEFFKQKHECKHIHVPVDAEEAYCPDCGELIRNKWYLIRCSSCNIKRTAHIEYDEFKPDTKYCPNCGGTDFYVQELDNINYIDLHYAVLKKIVIPQGHNTTRQIWIEQEGILPGDKKLIGFSK